MTDIIVNIIIIFAILGIIIYITHCITSKYKIFRKSSNNSSWLDEHNKYRKQAGYEPVVWSNNLMKQAKKYAEKISKTGNIDQVYNHAECKNNICGSNIDITRDKLPMPKTTVSKWYNEKSASTGLNHYTQMIWKNNRKIGCSIVGKVAVCLYDNVNNNEELDVNIP